MSTDSYKELKAELAGQPQLQEALRRLWPLSVFATRSILPNGYLFPAVFMEAVHLSPSGEALATQLRENLPAASASDIHAAIFGHFWHNDLLVDPLACDHTAIASSLSEEIQTGRIRYPFAFGRELYDKYYDTFRHERVAPSADTTQELLKGTPQGVFQRGHWVSGPYGLIASPVMRLFGPITSAPVAHCRNTECQQVHSVPLRTGETVAGTAYEHADRLLAAQSPTTGAWSHVLVDLVVSDNAHAADIHTGGLLWLVGNALDDAELRHLMSVLLDWNHAELRGHLSRIAPDLSGRADTIAHDLDRSSILQLMHLLPDSAIATELERLVKEHKIVVPATETRSALLTPPVSMGMWKQRAELSPFGIRFTSSRLPIGILRLKQLIHRLHPEEELAWRLVGQPGETTDQKMDSLIYTADLREIAEQYLVGTRTLFLGTSQYLGYSPLHSPTNEHEKEFLISEVLWKLGFEVPRFPSLNLTFWRQFDALSQAVEAFNEPNQEIIERVRGAATNLFVSLEDVLDSALSFTSWAMLSDHYWRPRRLRFRMNKAESRSVMAQILNGREVGPGDQISVVSSGRNELYALVHGFQLLANVIGDLRGHRGEPEYLRPSDQWPTWAGISGMIGFPFRHRAPLLDLSQKSVDSIQEGLRSATRSMLAGNVMGVRNRIAHYGGEFPSKSDFRIALTGIEEAIRILETMGSVPMLFTLDRATEDAAGRKVLLLKNYRDVAVEIFSPSEFAMCDMPSPAASQVIFVAAELDRSAERLRFVYGESSPFADMWADYPRGRSALDHEAGEAVESVTLAEPPTGGEFASVSGSL